MKDDSENQLKARSYRLVQWLKYILFLRKTSHGATNLVRKEIIILQSGENIRFPTADCTVKLSGRDHEIQNSTSMQDQPSRSEELSGDLRGSSDECHPKDTTTVDGQARNDFGRSKGIYIYHHYVEPRVQLHVPKEETPLKYIDVVRTAHTTINVLLEH